jgi:membrane fusion protein (multidrug efflux system)
MLPPRRMDPMADPQKPPAHKKKVVALALVGGLAVLIAAGQIYHQTYGRYFQSTNNAYVQADSVTVSSKVAGIVEQVLVRANQDVQYGDPLVRIDARDYRAQAAQAEAEIGMARAQADNTRAQIREQQAAIAQARARLDAARESARFAEAEVARYEPLVASGAETRQQLARLRTEARQANAELAGHHAALAHAERRITALEAGVAQAEAQARAAEARLRVATVNVEASLITASTDGRIGNLAVRTGQYAQIGQRMMAVVPLGRLYVEANFKETQVGLMRIGQPVRIEVDALPNVEIVGRVTSISPGTGAQFSLLPPQNATGNFTKIVQRVPVRIAIEAATSVQALLVPGLSVEAEVDTRSASDDLTRLAQAGGGR